MLAYHIPPEMHREEEVAHQIWCYDLRLLQEAAVLYLRLIQLPHSNRRYVKLSLPNFGSPTV